MRTTAETKISPAAEPRETVTGRRGRAAPKSQPLPGALPAPSQPEPPAVAVTMVRMLRVDEGLYALRIGEIAGSPSEVAGLTVPAAHVSAPFAEDGNGVE